MMKQCYEDRITSDIRALLLTFLNAKELMVCGALAKEHYLHIQDERLWIHLQKTFPVSFPWTLRPLSSRQHVLHLEKVRHSIKRVLPVLPVPSLRKTYEAKLVLIGDRNVGSTSLTDRFVRNTFEETTSSDGSDMRVRFAYLQTQGYNFRVKIFDIRQSVRRTPFSNVLYDGPSAILLLFDITSLESFVKLSNIIYELERHVLADASGIRASSPRTPPANTFGLIPRILVGTKADLDAKRKVSFEQASNFARQNNMIYIETSAKTGEAVELPFFMGISKIVKQEDWIKHSYPRQTTCNSSCRPVAKECDLPSRMDRQDGEATNNTNMPLMGYWVE